MKRNRPGAVLPLLLAVALLSGCSGSSTFLSEAEKRTVYALSFTSVASKTISGSSLEAGSEIELAMTQMSGSKSPECLEIALQDSGGTTIASLSLATTRYSRAFSTATLVDSLTGDLPSFRLPETLPPGIYTLVSIVSDKDGVELQSTETTFFVGGPDLGLGSLSIYPPSPSKSSPVLLYVGVKGADAATDAWIRWAYEGRTIAEGPVSGGFDKIVWRTPSIAGAYSLSVELYPAEPPANLGMASPWRQESKAIVSDVAAIDSEEFSDSSRFVSHLAFDGDFLDTGTRPQTDRPNAYGAPPLDIFPGGFGYSLGEAAYVEIPGAAPPADNGTLKPFSLAWRLYSLSSTGELVRFEAPDGTTLLHAGIEDGKPYVEVADVSGLQRSTCEVFVQPGLSNIAVSFEPGSETCAITWSIEGMRYAGPSLAVPPLSAVSSCKLGGPDSLKGTYDEFAISDDAQGRLPFFHAAALRAWKSGLFIGEGFEGKVLPQGTTVKGSAVATPGQLALKPGSRLSFERELPLARPLCVDVAYEGERNDMGLELSGADGFLLSVNGAGEVRGRDGGLLGLLRPVEEGRMALIVRTTPEGIELAPEGGLPAVAIRIAEPPSSLKVALCDLSTSGDVRVGTFLVRSAPEALSLADGPRAAALR